VTSGGGECADRRRVAVTSALDVCTFVEELDSSDVGELQLEGAAGPSGTVFIEGRRICWAMARGLARRLTQLLVAHTTAPAAAVEEVVLECVADGSPLGEQLLAAGLVTAPQLRSTLLQHAAESLAVACLGPAWGVWQPRRQRGYASRFTFTTAEMLTTTVAGEEPAAADAARRLIERALGDDDCGVAFVRRGGHGGPLPLALTGAWPTDTRTLLRVGRWAASALDVAAVAGEEPTIATSRRGAYLVAWPASSLVLVAMTSELGSARILTRRLATLGAARRGSDGRL
jgi:hypothetical protein